jgi:DNA invertase Pin-like site-specific DNA recombinase
MNMNMLGAVFEFERDLLIERTKARSYAPEPKGRL